MKRQILSVVCIVMLLLSTGCSLRFEQPQATTSFFAMDTYMEMTVSGEAAQKAVDDAQRYIEKLDKHLSTTNKSSEISILNSQKKLEKTSTDTYDIVKRSKMYNDYTDGAFNIALYPVSKLWGFTTNKYRVPDETEIEKKLSHTDDDDILLDESNNSITLVDERMELDLGGIAKGYAADKVMNIFQKNGCNSAIISLGHNVQTLGVRPDGKKWRVAILDPEDEAENLGVVSVESKAVVTSGGYERYFEEDGILYHHIINPDTGYPSQSDLLSVSIVCKDGVLADVLSTALFVKGYDGAVDFWKRHYNVFDMVLCTNEHKVYITSGLREDFESNDSYLVIENDIPPIEITNLSVGKADAALVRMGDCTGIIDTGNEDSYAVIQNVLNTEGITNIDFMILSHFDNDHIGSAAEIMRNYSVKDVYVPDYSENTIAYEGLVNAYPCAENINVIKDIKNVSYGGVRIEFLPMDDKQDLLINSDDVDNDVSLVCRIDVGEKRFLFTGDIEKYRMEQLCEYHKDELKCDWVKLPNHGKYKKHEKKFINATGATYAVISTDLSNPPQTKLLEHLEKKKIAVFSTSNGNVTTTFDDADLIVK